MAETDTMQVIHVLGSYQVFTMPVFDMLEYLMASP